MLSSELVEALLLVLALAAQDRVLLSCRCGLWCGAPWKGVLCVS